MRLQIFSKSQVFYMRFEVRTQGVCAKALAFGLEGDIVTNVRFAGGCDGNLKAIAKLVDGMTVETIESYLLGNTCGSKNTSCADQLARGVRLAYEKMQAVTAAK